MLAVYDGTDPVDENAANQINENYDSSTVNTISEESNNDIITPDIKLGKSGGKILLTCEDGIVDFIKELKRDKTNGLPNKMTGVIIHYLTKGIERDFGRTWTETPCSIKEPISGSKNSQYQVRTPSKREKNELIKKSTWDFYEEDVDSGKITREEAMSLMFEAIDKIKELKDAGLVISKKKTEGVKKFDAATEVNKNYEGSKDYHQIYKKKNWVIVVPNVLDYKNARIWNRTYDTQLKKCGYFWDEFSVNGSLTEATDKQFGNAYKNWSIKNELITIHILKSSVIGQQKPRYICYEGINNNTGKQSLLIVEGSPKGMGGPVAEVTD